MSCVPEASINASSLFASCPVIRAADGRIDRLVKLEDRRIHLIVHGWLLARDVVSLCTGRKGRYPASHGNDKHKCFLKEWQELRFSRTRRVSKYVVETPGFRSSTTHLCDVCPNDGSRIWALMQFACCSDECEYECLAFQSCSHVNKKHGSSAHLRTWMSRHVENISWAFA